VITILFDIDGTLIRSGGAGWKAIEAVMQEMFGLESVHQVPLGGRTDNGIFNDLFDAHSLSFEDHRETFSQKYWEQLPSALVSGNGTVLPGVEALLNKVGTLEDVASGILTGNAKIPAWSKVRHFGLGKFFKFGGYGDDHSNRNDVAQLAKTAASEFLGDRFESDRVWVVGDTVNDIDCARSIDAKVVAVETGGCDPLELKAAEPDLLLTNLDELDQFLEVVIGMS